MGEELLNNSGMHAAEDMVSTRRRTAEEAQPYTPCARTVSTRYSKAGDSQEV